MPQIARTTSGMSTPSSATIQARITALRSSIVAGAVITAAQINELRSMFVSFNDHFHTTADYAFEAFGNTAPTGSFYDTNPENTSGMYDSAGAYGQTGGGEPAAVAVGDTITAAKHEELKTMFNRANGHYHTVNDRVY